MSRTKKEIPFRVRDNRGKYAKPSRFLDLPQEVQGNVWTQLIGQFDVLVEIEDLSSGNSFPSFFLTGLPETANISQTCHKFRADIRMIRARSFQGRITIAIPFAEIIPLLPLISGLQGMPWVSKRVTSMHLKVADWRKRRGRDANLWLGIPQLFPGLKSFELEVKRDELTDYVTWTVQEYESFSAQRKSKFENDGDNEFAALIRDMRLLNLGNVLSKIGVQMTVTLTAYHTITIEDNGHVYGVKKVEKCTVGTSAWQVIRRDYETRKGREGDW